MQVGPAPRLAAARGSQMPQQCHQQRANSFLDFGFLFSQISSVASYGAASVQVQHQKWAGDLPVQVELGTRMSWEPCTK